MRKLTTAIASTVAAAFLTLTLTPSAQAAAAAPPGCTLRIIDAGRTSEARCAPGPWRHHTMCRYGENTISYVDHFTTYHTRSCPSPYRVGLHSILHA
jgi:hypothetical protein